MKITIEINTDNAAFEDRGQEIHRLLSVVQSKIIKGLCGGPLYDFNGNKVGKFEVID